MKLFLPEWASQKSVLLAFPNEATDWNSIIDEARNQYIEIIRAFVEDSVKVVLLCDNIQKTYELLQDVPHENIHLIEAPFNDTWTRDYGPISVEEDGKIKILDFGFNGWGLKFAADKDNLVNLFLTNKGIFNKDFYVNHRDFFLEGGSIETDGNGLLLTTSECLCSPNRNGGKSKTELTEILKDSLGVSEVVFLDYGSLKGDDTDSHIDTLARLAPENIILYCGCSDPQDVNYEPLKKMKKQLQSLKNKFGEPFNLIELPSPDPIFDEEGARLPATYTNYLIINSTVFVPTYNQELNDMLALQMIKIAFPSHNIVGIDCTTLIKQHGSLHCATMQLPFEIN